MICQRFTSTFGRLWWWWFSRHSSLSVSNGNLWTLLFGLKYVDQNSWTWAWKTERSCEVNFRKTGSRNKDRTKCLEQDPSQLQTLRKKQSFNEKKILWSPSKSHDFLYLVDYGSSLQQAKTISLTIILSRYWQGGRSKQAGSLPAGLNRLQLAPLSIHAFYHLYLTRFAVLLL